MFLYPRAIHEHMSRRQLANVCEAHIEHVWDDDFGRVSSGSLQLACHIRKANDRTARNGLWHVLERYLFTQWCEHFDDTRVSCAGCWFCVLEFCGVRRTENELGWEMAYLIGIILEPVDLSQRIFRRVGLFAHPWGEHIPSRYKEQCPEFADVARLEDMEQEEVTII